MKLNIQNITFGFSKDKIVLNDISLQSNENKIIAIVGASGSGKSTLLRLLCGIIKQERKQFFEGNISVDTYSPMAYNELGKIGFMFQEATLFPNLTVKENIALPLKLAKVKDVNSEIDRLIEMVGLTEFANYLPKNLSGGMKTRTALARTFITKPELILLDEPFGSLDIKWKFTLYRELEKLRQTYSPMVIMVTHDIQEALLLSNHIIVFGQGGKILKEISVDKSLPRVFETDAIKNLQNEYVEIQNLIMNN